MECSLTGSPLSVGEIEGWASAEEAVGRPHSERLLSLLVGFFERQKFFYNLIQDLFMLLFPATFGTALFTSLLPQTNGQSRLSFLLVISLAVACVGSTTGGSDVIIFGEALL